MHRIARIYFLSTPPILLAATLDTLGRWLFAGAGFYEPSFLQKHYAPRLSFTDLVNLQGIVAHYYNDNGPLQSVGHEFWRHVLFPTILPPWRRPYPLRVA